MTSQKTLTARTWSELILLGVIWGMSFLAIRIALDTIPVITSVFHRVFWAALALWIVIIFQRQPVPSDPKVWGIFLIMGLLNNVLPFSLMAWGQLYVETGLTSILNAATAIFGVLLAALFFRDERLTKTRLLGVGLGFLGVSITIGLRQFSNLNPSNLGQVAILAGTLSYAFAAIWARSHMSALPPQIAAAGMLTGSAILMTPVMLLVDGVPTFTLPLQTWLAIAYYALLATAGAYLLYYRVLQQAGSGNVLLVTLIIPPIAILMGALVRDEALPPRAFIGFTVLAIGLLILSRSRRRD